VAGKTPNEEEEPLAGSWWDGADQDVRRIFRELREIKNRLRKLPEIEDRQIEFKTLLEDLPEVRKSKTRTRQLDTGVAGRMRQAMLDEGIPLVVVDRVVERFLTTTRPGRDRDTVRLAVKRLGSGKSKPSPDKKSR
jgi:hypothetical protein